MQYLCIPRLFDGDAFYRDMAIGIRGAQIVDVRPQRELPEDAPTRVFREGTIAPGFIDLQVNGGGGVLLNNQPDTDAIEQITRGHRRAGTTGLMPTLISDTPAVHRQAVQAAITSRRQGNNGVLGVHIEGPFFNPARRGTHRQDMIRVMSEADVAWLAAIEEVPLMLTLAPEHTRAGQIRALSAAGIMVCAGHTDASYEQVEQALAEGLRGFTHLYNAMSPLASRAPGVVGAALDCPHSWVGIIADGHHVHPASIRIAQRAKARGKLLLVSDAMATVGSSATSFEIYGERIELQDGKLLNAEGNLAGSAIGMIDAVRYSHQHVGLALEECLRMASLYPAEFLSMQDTLGRVAPGYRADLVLFDESLRVTDTWVAAAHQSHSAPS